MQDFRQVDFAGFNDKSVVKICHCYNSRVSQQTLFTLSNKCGYYSGSEDQNYKVNLKRIQNVEKGRNVNEKAVTREAIIG